METSQEQNSTSKQETEDSIARLSSCSSSSCSSIEAYQELNNNQSPPTQIMERIDTTTTTSSPKTPSSYRIPSHAFARATSTAPVDWSCMSNESLFSIRMGNNSFVNGDNFFKSGELSFPQPPSPVTPSLSTPKAPVDIGKKAAETEKTSQASKEEEQKAAANIREVIMANEAANNNNNNNNNKPNKFDRTVSRTVSRTFSRTVSRRSEDLSVKSFAFPVLGNADKGGLQGASTQKKQPEIPKISTEGDEGLKKEEVPASDTPSSKAEASKSNSKWLSCFPCCG